MGSAYIRVLPGAKTNFKATNKIKSTNKKRAHSTFDFWHILKSKIAKDLELKAIFVGFKAKNWALECVCFPIL